MLNIGSDRECFWDEYLIDPAKTTAEFLVHHPVRREAVIRHDAPWEGDGCNYHCVFRDGGVYRMYYNANEMISSDKQQHTVEDNKICYAESRDGLNWTKPDLGICEFDGSTQNNIVIDRNSIPHLDNFFVFRDDNPACPADRKYKAITRHKKALYCFYSAAPWHFREGDLITADGYFDSLNVFLWDARAGLYRGYFRGFHNVPGDDWNAGVRDIRYIESTDFVHWTDPVILDFGGAEDFPLYTSVVSIYERAPQMLIGFPTRYVERHAWNGSFEELCGKEKRQERIRLHPRYGLTITDCVFMCSRDGAHYRRYDEAFIRPEPEHPCNWVYGDCYPAVGWVPTPSSIEGADPELSTYLPDNHWMSIPSVLYRYTIRADGFVSLHAGAKEREIVTKPFIFKGSELTMNLETSARGYIYVALEAENGTKAESCETFGNSINRKIAFDDPEAVKRMAGKPVTMRIRMLDADVYSVRFC